MGKGRVLIVGGGIGGLAAALGLQRSGLSVSVFEQADEIREVGAGVLITPNGQRALESLGVLPEVIKDASVEPVSFFIDHDSGRIVRETRAIDVIARHGLPVLQVHRADLQRALKEAVDANDPTAIQCSHRFERAENTSSGVTVFFKNGRAVAGDALVGADGNASSVRAAVFDSEPSKFIGQVAFRALIPVERIPIELGDRMRALHMGPDRMFLHYPLRKGALMNVIGLGRTDKWEEEGWAIPASTAEFRANYADFNEDVLRLIESVPTGSLFKWGLRDREPLKTWTKGRITMLGDAAHPITPFLGQGANIALEDGAVLGRAVEQSVSLEQAFERYELARKQRGTQVQLWSREQARMLQGGTGIDSNPGCTAEQRGLFSYDPAVTRWEE